MAGNFRAMPVFFLKTEENHAWLGTYLSDFGAGRRLYGLFWPGGPCRHHRQIAVDRLCHPVDRQRLFRCATRTSAHLRGGTMRLPAPILEHPIESAIAGLLLMAF